MLTAARPGGSRRGVMRGLAPTGIDARRRDRHCSCRRFLPLLLIRRLDGETPCMGAALPRALPNESGGARERARTARRPPRPGFWDARWSLPEPQPPLQMRCVRPLRERQLAERQFTPIRFAWRRAGRTQPTLQYSTPTPSARRSRPNPIGASPAAAARILPAAPPRWLAHFCRWAPNFTSVPRRGVARWCDSVHTALEAWRRARPHDVTARTSNALVLLLQSLTTHSHGHTYTAGGPGTGLSSRQQGPGWVGRWRIRRSDGQEWVAGCVMGGWELVAHGSAKGEARRKAWANGVCTVMHWGCTESGGARWAPAASAERGHPLCTAMAACRQDGQCLQCASAAAYTHYKKRGKMCNGARYRLCWRRGVSRQRGPVWAREAQGKKEALRCLGQ
jgi:hypothetical protein